jgi:hypothetical protein
VDGLGRDVLEELMVNRAYAPTDIHDDCIPHTQLPHGTEKFARLARRTLPAVAAHVVGSLFLAERTIRDVTTTSRQP